MRPTVDWIALRHRRHGIATAMLHAMPIRPSFSDQGNTPEGDAWINAMQKGTP